MNTSRTAIAMMTISLVVIGLSACSSGSDDAQGHDHSAHERTVDVAPAADAHEGHDQGAHDSSADAHGAGDMGMGLKKIEPSADYPLTTCVVSGEPLGGMGEVIAFEYDGEEVQFCCAGCVDEFKESPAVFVAKVREADVR